VSSLFRIDWVEAALVALLKSKLAGAYGQNVSVDSLGDKDFDEQGRLVLQPPAARVRFLDAPFQNLRDNQRLTYQVPMSFEILFFQSSLRSPADERKQTLVLLGAGADVVTGARLELSDGSKSMPVAIKRAYLIDTLEGPVDQAFAVQIEVEGIAQFSGANANPN
jgi:hypothetical protein